VAELDLDEPENERLRSWYLEQAPAEVKASLGWLHGQAAQSPNLKDKIHTDRVLTYVASLTALVMRQNMTISSAGLDEEDR
jgi:hypothetical protein